MEDKDKIIDSLRKQLRDANSKISALEQEVELLNYEARKKVITELRKSEKTVRKDTKL